MRAQEALENITNALEYLESRGIKGGDIFDGLVDTFDAINEGTLIPD